MSQKWSESQIVASILSRRARGERLNSGHVQVHCIPLYQSACKYFGSWRKAIEAAGLSYDEVRVVNFARPVWSKEKIVSVIQNRYQLNLPLNSNHIQKREKRLYGACITYFGGWPQAVTAAGLDYSMLRKQNQRTWSKIAIVEEVANRHSRALSIRGGDVCLEDRGLYLAARRFFGRGGWSIARILAGFDPIDRKPNQIWNEKSICEEILRLHENHVLLNTCSLQKSEYSYILGSARNVFGSWAEAIRASGLDYRKIRKLRTFGWWTKPRIILCIRNLEKRGIRLSHKSMQKSHGSLVAAALVHFGSWSEAVEAAGISYQRHCLVWSSKAYVRRTMKAADQR